MKKYLRVILAVIFYTSLLLSCKKDSTPKDYTASVKDKTWWGMLTYTGQTAEYYSVHFNADNTLVWSELSGDFTGHWAITNKQITITFASTTQVKADISDDDKLINITDNTGYYEINSGQIIANPNITLDNTVWKGTASLTTPTTLRFKSGLKVEAELGNNVYGSDTYKRSASGEAIESELNPGYTLFVIVVSENKIRGADNLGYQWQLTKQ
jgi:hypothetical protein